MIPLGLTSREQAAFHRQLETGYDLDVRVELMDLEENRLATLTSWIMGGQVVVDADEMTTRSCQLTLLDPEHRSGIDPSTAGAPTYLNRMIYVTYGVWVDSLERWVRVPVFRGPISKVDRDGDTLDIEALGKEHLLRREAGWSKVYPAGALRTDVIKDIARKSGERRLSIPSWRQRTGKSTVMVKLGVQSHPWSWMRIAAHSMRAQIWYDGSGRLRLRKRPTRVSWHFKEHHLLSTPKVTVDDEEIFNHVWVKGAAPEGKKTVIEARGFIAASHRFSAQRLARNGHYGRLTDKIEDDSIRSLHDARVARDRRIKEIEIVDYTVEFDCIPVPHLDPNDMAHLAWDEAPGQFRVKKFTIPLVAGESMSMGYTKETRHTANMKKAHRMRARNRAREAAAIKKKAAKKK